MTIFLRFDTEVSNLDETGFDVTITRTDTNDPNAGWWQRPFVYFTTKRKSNQTCMTAY